ncbi:hypothetical protein C9374_007097 [Naegleria lovaniensis]|uniref:PWI domain-containing protein n=1 Tax=Naegleria lovaniensis TaxID=51637 RepID=A0AA88H6L3_NAELO|nr:uncharacterized protein C9374_007097 [Naegleria lovaniensis]KAG2393566.1 hypothetical protein C9374_007097 [Naegleria lovaniensis]
MRGTASLEQDARFTNKDKALVQSTKFPKGFDIKVDMSKVNLEVFKLWIHSKIEELTGSDDDMISEYAISMLQDSSPDPKQMQIQLAGFLTIDNAAVFMTELWKLLVEAQNSPSGVPKALLSLEMERVKKEQEEQEKISRKFQERIPNRYYNSTTSYQQQQIRGTTHHHTAKHPRPYDRSSSNRQQRQTTPSSVSDNAQQEATEEQKEGEKPSLGSERRLNTTDSSDYKRDQSHFRNRYDQHRGNFNSGQQNLVSRRTERRSNSIDFYEKPTFKERADKIADKTVDNKVSPPRKMPAHENQGQRRVPPPPPPSSSEEDSDSDGDNYINERRKTVDEFDRLRKRALASMQANSKR